MKAITCECGKELRADDAQALADKVQEHIRLEHPEKELSDEEILQLLTTEARDV